ncbi:hypothetical protein H0H93_005981, partial [Arthromyces matolae]
AVGEKEEHGDQPPVIVKDFGKEEITGASAKNVADVTTPAQSTEEVEGTEVVVEDEQPVSSGPAVDDNVPSDATVEEHVEEERDEEEVVESKEEPIVEAPPEPEEEEEDEEIARRKRIAEKLSKMGG